MKLETIYSKCEEVGECLEWQGYVTKHGEPVTSKKKIRRLVWEQTKGPIPEGMVVTYGSNCVSSRCVCHLRVATKRAITQRTAKDGKFSGPTRSAAITAGRRKQVKYPQELVEQVRSSPLTPTQAAAHFEVPRSWIYKVRAGMRRDLTNPFAGLFTGLAANDSGRKRA